MKKLEMNQMEQVNGARPKCTQEYFNGALAAGALVAIGSFPIGVLVFGGMMLWCEE